MKQFSLKFILTANILSGAVLANPEAYNKLDNVLQAIGQGINSGSVKVEDKKIARSFILNLRKDLMSGNMTYAHASSVLNKLEYCIAHNFDKDLDLNRVVRSNFRTESIDDLDDRLKSIEKRTKGLGATLRPVLLSLESLDKKLYLSAITKRLLPYAALGLYYTTITKREHLPQWSWLQSMKSVLGGAPSSSTKTVKSMVEGSEEVIPGNNGMLLMRKQVGIDENGQPRYEDVSVSPAQLNAISNHKMANSYENSRSSAITYNGIFGTPMAMLAKLIPFDSSTPLIKIVPATLIWPYIKQDLSDISNWTIEQKDKIYAYLKGEKFKDKKTFKASRSKFKDVIGYENNKAKLMPLINYFNNKSLFDLAGVQPDRGYLFVGESEAGSTLAQAIAGEIKDAKIKEIHASTLLNGFKSIMTDADSDEVNILVIKDLDWLVNKKISNGTWEEVISGFDKYLSGSGKTYIIGIAANENNVDPVLKSYNRLGTKIALEDITLENLEAFITKELEDIAVDLENFDVSVLAQSCLNISSISYKQIQAIIKKAFVNAQAMNEKFEHNHIKALLA